MSAYNWIEFKNECPSCKKESTIKSQTHMASSYDGYEGMRFHDNVYHVGETMMWYPLSDSKYQEWKNGNYRNKSTLPENVDMECCYSECTACKSELFTVIKFTDCTVNSIEATGNIEEWPDEYYK